MSWRYGLVAKSTGCTSRGCRFKSQHPQGDSQLFVAPVPGALLASADVEFMVHTHMLAKHYRHGSDRQPRRGSDNRGYRHGSDNRGYRHGSEAFAACADHQSSVPEKLPTANNSSFTHTCPIYFSLYTHIHTHTKIILKLFS